MRVIEGEFDYVICGGGTAGCLLANRLSKDPTKQVLLLEAGGKDDWIWFHIPVGYLFAIGNPRSDWLYKTEPEAGLNGRALSYPRGKAFGGSSAINAMIVNRCQAADYDHWRQLGLTGWGWDDVKPLFRDLEDHFLGPSEDHGKGGPWRVEYPRVTWDILDAVGKAAEEMGVPATPDPNLGDNEGVGLFHVNQKKGLRWSSARGFLKPVIDKRDNLSVMGGVQVEKLEIRDGRVTGVIFRQGGKQVLVKCRGEVVLASGSIGSVQIMELSGIGKGDVLQAAGVPVVQARDGVGENLQDHLQLRMIFKVQGAKTLNETYHNLFQRAWMGVEYALWRTGPLTMAPSQLGIFTRSTPDRDRANIQFHIQPLSLDKFGDPLHRFPAVTVSVCNLRPSSRGSIHIRSNRLEDHPRIAPHYLTTEDDRKVAADSIRVGRKLMQQAALSPYAPQEILPGPATGDDEAALGRAAGDIGTTIFHPVGTLKMGRADDPSAVVDERGRVIGLHGLRVADASVMPTITSGNTATPTIMIAENIARMMIADARA